MTVVERCRTDHHLHPKAIWPNGDDALTPHDAKSTTIADLLSARHHDELLAMSWIRWTWRIRD